MSRDSDAAKNPRGPVRPSRRKVTWVKPPKAAQSIARRALERRAALPPSKRGGWSRSKAGAAGITSGVARAESIARGDEQPAEDIHAFFARFSGTYADSIATKSWENAKVQQAWDLWGGRPMWDAARKALGKRVENPEGILASLGTGVAFGVGLALGGEVVRRVAPRRKNPASPGWPRSRSGTWPPTNWPYESLVSQLRNAENRLRWLEDNEPDEGHSANDLHTIDALVNDIKLLKREMRRRKRRTMQRTKQPKKNPRATISKYLKGL